jgi:hypothetical protein
MGSGSRTVGFAPLHASQKLAARTTLNSQVNLSICRILSNWIGDQSAATIQRRGDTADEMSWVICSPEKRTIEIVQDQVDAVTIKQVAVDIRAAISEAIISPTIQFTGREDPRWRIPRADPVGQRFAIKQHCREAEHAQKMVQKRFMKFPLVKPTAPCIRPWRSVATSILGATPS